jgi:hypothetical protein
VAPLRAWDLGGGPGGVSLRLGTRRRAPARALVGSSFGTEIEKASSGSSPWIPPTRRSMLLRAAEVAEPAEPPRARSTSAIGHYRTRIGPTEAERRATGPIRRVMGPVGEPENVQAPSESIEIA